MPGLVKTGLLYESAQTSNGTKKLMCRFSKHLDNYQFHIPQTRTEQLYTETQTALDIFIPYSNILTPKDGEDVRFTAQI